MGRVAPGKAVIIRFWPQADEAQYNQHAPAGALVGGLHHQ
jgi:hypothetical protein